MRTIETNCLSGSIKKRNLQIYSFIMALCSVIALFFSTNIFAQTFPTSCTSKDLTLLRADLPPAPGENRCNCNGNRALYLGIHNGTNSFRTAFALWGTLRRTDANNNVTNYSIFACASGVLGKTDNFLPASTIEIKDASGNPVTLQQIQINSIFYPAITITCGESLDIVDMHLAWTSASPSETCDVLKNNPSTINPKCGVQDQIHVGIGVDGAVDLTPATCTSGGKIKVTPSGGIGPYEVKLDNGNYIAVPANPGYYEFPNVTAGQHTITIRDNTSKPEAERCIATKTPTLGSTTPPTASIVANRTTVNCTNTSATLTASGGGTYSWSPGGATTAQITVSPTTTTTYTVTVTDANGCTDQKSQQITVDQTAPTAGIVASRTTVNCTNTSATLTASGGGTYSWSPGGATTAQITVSPTTTTTYTVTVTGTNGCTDQKSQQISVDQTAPTAAIVASRTTVNCTNTSATLTASGGGTYSWSPGGATTAQITVSPTTTTTYTVTVTGTNGCTDQKSQQISVDQTAPTFKVCITQPTLCNRGSLTIVPDAPGTYRYSIDGTTFLSANTTNFSISSPNATFSNLLTGDVTSVKIQNNTTGCYSAGLSCSSLSANLASSCTSSGITSKVQEESLLLTNEPTVKAYPNPFNDRVKFIINSPAAGNGSLEVYNVMGQRVKTVYQGRINAGNQSYELVIPKKQQETLIYVLRVDGKKVTGKLLQLNN
jgi:hypothetical protein